MDPGSLRRRQLCAMPRFFSAIQKSPSLFGSEATLASMKFPALNMRSILLRQCIAAFRIFMLDALIGIRDSACIISR